MIEVTGQFCKRRSFNSKKFHYTFNLSLILVASVLMAPNVLCAKTDKETVLHLLQEKSEQIELLKEDLGNSINEEILVQKLNQLLALYEERAKLFEESGDMAQAYDTLQQAYTFEIMVNSLGQNNLVITTQLARLKLRLLYFDGPGLLSVLKSKSIPKHEKYRLVDLLESIVGNDTIFKASIPEKPQIFLPEFAAKLEEISKEINEGVANLPHKNEKNYEEAVKKVLGKYLHRAEVLSNAGYAAKAYMAYSKALEMEEQTLGKSMGERSVTPFKVGQFHSAILYNGDMLLDVIHSKEIPLTKKKDLLFNLKDGIRIEHKRKQKGNFAF